METKTHDDLPLTSQGISDKELQKVAESKNEGKSEIDTSSPVKARPFLYRVVRVTSPSTPVRVSVNPAREEEKALIRRVNRSR